MRSEELSKKINEIHFFLPQMVYQKFIRLEKESDFNLDEQRKFIALYTQANMGEITSKTYQNSINKYTTITDKIDQLLYRLNEVSPDWLEISGKNATPEENYMKIYLSVDNQDIHYFANKMIKSLVDKQYDDYEFKINNDSRINRRDSFVIYCNPLNIGKYIELTAEMLDKYPEIRLNPPHLLGIPYNDKITCGVDARDNSKSHTEIFCENICQELKNGKTPNLVASIVETQLEEDSTKLKYLIESSKENNK